MRPDDDDDRQRPTPRKKGGSGLMIVLLVVGGVLVLGCVACGGFGYWVYTRVEDGIANASNPNVSSTNAERIRVGMTKSQVEAILGLGRPANRELLRQLAANPISEQAKQLAASYDQHWAPLADQGLVHEWRFQPYHIAVAYDAPPDAGGKVRAVAHHTQRKGGGSVYEELIPVSPTATTKPDGPKSGTTRTKTNELPEPTNTKITAVELATNPTRYTNKAVTVVGQIKDIDPTADGGNLMLETGPEKTVRCVMSADALRKAMAGGHGGSVIVEGTVSGVAGPFVDVINCHVVQASAVGSGIVAGSMAREFQSNAEKADAKYKGKMVRVTGRLVAFEMGTVSTVVIHGVDMLKGKAGSKPVRLVVAYPAAWKDEYARKKVGDTITVSGEYSSYADGTIAINSGWLLH